MLFLTMCVLLRQLDEYEVITVQSRPAVILNFDFISYWFSRYKIISIESKAILLMSEILQI